MQMQTGAKPTQRFCAQTHPGPFSTRPTVPSLNGSHSADVRSHRAQWRRKLTQKLEPVKPKQTEMRSVPRVSVHEQFTHQTRGSSRVHSGCFLSYVSVTSSQMATASTSVLSIDNGPVVLKKVHQSWFSVVVSKAE